MGAQSLLCFMAYILPAHTLSLELYQCNHPLPTPLPTIESEDSDRCFLNQWRTPGPVDQD